MDGLVLDRIIEEEQGHWFVRDKEVKSSFELVVHRAGPGSVCAQAGG